jgi:hypothetical protein
VPPVVKALVVPKPRQPRTHAPPTYRLTLEREGGAVVYTWGAIPHEKVGPLLQTMRTYLPWMARAAAAKDALAKLLDLFR